MSKFLGLVRATVGGWLGWWIGAHVGIMTAFLLSMVGTGLGMYGSTWLYRQYGS